MKRLVVLLKTTMQVNPSIQTFEKSA